MKYFKEKLYENYLVLKRGVQGLPKSIPLQTVRIKNLQYLPFYRNDYIDCVKKYIRKYYHLSKDKSYYLGPNFYDLYKRGKCVPVSFNEIPIVVD